MRSFDRHTIDEVGVPSLALMETAGRAVAAEAEKHGDHFVVVAGTGNNGGDGLVAARTLVARGLHAVVVMIGEEGKLSDDAKVCLKGCQHLDVSWGLDALELKLASHPHAVLVDALFGTGLSRAIEGDAAVAIEKMNAHETPIVAVDVPSGLDSDRGVATGPIVRATTTVTFGYAKRGLYAAPGFTFAGEIIVADIGLAASLADDVKVRLLDESILAPFRVRDPLGHKGTHGHVFLLAGSVGKIGASLLAGRAALRAGAGLVTLATPLSAQARVDGKLAELMTFGYPGADPEGGHGLDVGKAVAALVAEVNGKRVVAIGPGVSTAPAFAEVIEKLVYAAIAEGVTVVLDADGLNHLAHRPSILAGRPGSGTVVLTPHPGEAARLLGTTVRDIEADRYAAVKALVKKYDAIVALKGARTLVASPDGRVLLCAAGGPVLGVGGTGDVLTGATAALCANRNAPVFESVAAAVFLHATAADLLAAETSRGVLAGEIADALPHALG
ncbi:MAG: NAD(P)H-hydrate dehydratase [Polyangia bacterium]